MDTWTVAEVVQWLISIDKDFIIYKKAFTENVVTGKLLLSLTSKDLKDELHIYNLGHRKLILQRISKNFYYSLVNVVINNIKGRLI